MNFDYISHIPSKTAYSPMRLRSLEFAHMRMDTRFIAPFITAYWSVAVSAALYKLFDSRVDALLRYGLRRQYPNHDSFASSFPLSVLLNPSRGIASSKCWKLFYTTGIASCVACGMLFRSHTPLLLFLVHTTRRLIECMYVHKFSSSTISLAHLCMGASFYIFAAPTLTLYEPVNNSNNNHNIPYLSILVFVIAQFIQHNAHRALASTIPIVGKYGVPRGFGFGAVACPHYSAEIIIYGVLLFEAPSIASALLFAFVVINLSHSGIQNVEWYRRTFSKHLAANEMRYAIVKYVF